MTLLIRKKIYLIIHKQCWLFGKQFLFIVHNHFAYIIITQMLVKLLDPAPISYVGRVLALYRADPSSFGPSDESDIQKNITVRNMRATCNRPPGIRHRSLFKRTEKYTELSDPSCFVQIRSSLRLKMVLDTDYQFSLIYPA